MSSGSNYEASSRVRADFDLAASFPDAKWDHNSHYHRFLLRHVPAHCRNALDIGCGKGAFARLLAARADHVHAIDLSPNMIEEAHTLSVSSSSKIEYRVEDAAACDFGIEQFDCIASIATLHHLPAAELLPKLKRALRPVGVLIILDLYQSSTWPDMLADAVAVPTNILLRWIRLGRLREPEYARVFWTRHGRNETYPTMDQVRTLCDKSLPGAQVKRHLLWRYSIVWHKQAHGFTE